MDIHQLRKAVTERREFEYLFGDQWVPAIVENLHEEVPGSPSITLHLLHHPRDHSGVVYLNEGDIERSLRIQGSR